MTRSEFVAYMRHNTRWVNWYGVCRMVLGNEPVSQSATYLLDAIYEQNERLLGRMSVEALDMAIRLHPGATHLGSLVPSMLTREEMQRKYALLPREQALAFPLELGTYP